MAQAPTGQVQHVGTLGDVTSSHINITLVPRNKTSSPSVLPYTATDKLGVRYSPVQQRHLQKLLHSPHRAQVLRMNGIIDTQVKVMTRKPSTMSPLKDSIAMIPTSVFSQKPCTGQQEAAVSQVKEEVTITTTPVGKEVQSATPGPTNKGEVCVTPVPVHQSHNLISPLDKDLPSNPVLREMDSLERRGLYDASDSATKTLNAHYPPLQPDTDQCDSPSRSFEITPSLYSFNDNASVDVEYGHANAVELSQGPRPAKSKSGSLREQIVRSTVATNADGSPMQRKGVARKANPHDVRGREALSQNGRNRVDQRVEEDLFEKTKRAFEDTKTAPTSNGVPKQITRVADEDDVPPETPPKDYPPKENTPQRRSAKYGVGPTVRFSKDAHEVIMGDSSARSNTSAVVPSVPVTPQLNTSREIKVQLGNASMPEFSSNTKSAITESFPGRFSSLPNSPEYIDIPDATSIDKRPAFASRLSRPTAASQARAAEPKKSFLKRGKNATASNVNVNKSPKTPISKSKAGGSTASIGLTKSGSTTSFLKQSRGFRSRLSAILPGRRRMVKAEVANALGYNTINEESVKAESIIDNDVSVIHENARSASRNLTTYENSGMEGSPSDVIRSIFPGGHIFASPVDKSAPGESEHDQNEGQVAGYYDSRPNSQSATGNRVLNSTQPVGVRNPGDGEEPPSPPQSANDPQGHYTEGEENEWLWDETGLGAYLDQTLRIAEANLHDMINSARLAHDQVTKNQIIQLLNPLADAIKATRTARMQAIILMTANARLVRHACAESAVAAANARAMVAA